MIVREHARDLQIEDVARSIAASRRQLQRVFAEVGDTSFREVLTTVRMSHARRLLMDGRPVGEVAGVVGYRYQSQFTKAFQRRLGVTPRDFRRNASR